MKIVFFSSFLSPHMKPLCDILYNHCDFTYVETNELTKERRELGYDFMETIPYIQNLSNDKEKQIKLADSADCVIINTGAADAGIVLNRIRNNKLTFFCNERLFKKGIIKYADPRLWKQWYVNLVAHKKNTFLLCIGYFVCQDFEKIGFDKNKSFRFGYFPKHERSVTYVENTAIRIIWVGRMIDWKQPTFALNIAQELENRHIKYQIDMVGDGPMYSKVSEYRLLLKNPEAVSLHKTLSNSVVRQMMGNADVLLMTSNKQEGWGAVANEAMSNLTPVIAFESVGAANYLIQSGYNGILCKDKSISEMVDAVEQIKKERNRYSENAGKTMDVWNAEIAAQRLLLVVSALYNGEEVPRFDSGPLSKITRY